MARLAACLRLSRVDPHYDRSVCVILRDAQVKPPQATPRSGSRSLYTVDNLQGTPRCYQPQKLKSYLRDRGWGGL